MFFTPRPAASRRFRSSAACFVLILLAVATFASFGLPGSAEAPGTPITATPTIEKGDTSGPADSAGVRSEPVDFGLRKAIGNDAFITLARATIGIVTQMVLDALGAYWQPIENTLDWMQSLSLPTMGWNTDTRGPRPPTVHRGWPAVHRLPGTTAAHS